MKEKASKNIKRVSPELGMLVVLMLVAPAALGNPIFYEVENISGDVWQYTYTVGNETAAPIDQFTIFFDFDLYSFDLVTTPLGEQVDPSIFDGPSGWSLLVAPPDPFFPGPDDDQPGFYDGLALGAPLAPGELLAGFTIEFYWLGTGTPGSQAFTLGGGDLLPVPGDNFFTQQMGGTVPEPGTLALVALGILLLGLRKITVS